MAPLSYALVLRLYAFSYSLIILKFKKGDTLFLCRIAYESLSWNRSFVDDREFS